MTTSSRPSHTKKKLSDRIDEEWARIDKRQEEEKSKRAMLGPALPETTASRRKLLEL